MKVKCKLKDLLRSMDGKQVLSFEVISGLGNLDELIDKDLTVEIKPFRKRRSLDANAYFWVLCDKLAVKTGISKEEIYRESIKNIGGNSDTVCVVDEAVDKLRSAWERNGLGWQTEVLDSKIKGCTNVILYYGSSTYDTKQMARLIDNIVQDCKANDIETLPPYEIKRLKEAWK
jgi:hypothetical protein